MEANMPRKKVIEDLQVQTLKNIMKLPKSTPTIAVLGETGHMRMKHRIHKRQLNYIYKVENMVINGLKRYYTILKQNIFTKNIRT